MAYKIKSGRRRSENKVRTISRLRGLKDFEFSHSKGNKLYFRKKKS